MRKAGAIILLFVVLAALQGCYTFRQTSMPSQLKTVAIPVFDDHSGAGVAQFRGEVTKAIIDKVESQSTIRFMPSIARADALLEGSITTFSDAPGQLSSSTGRALTNRITIVVQVSMVDIVKKKSIYTQSYAGFADYPVGNYPAQQEAIRFALGQIIDDIVDRIISGW